MKNFFKFLILIVGVLYLFACDSNKRDEKTITMGISPGPYSILFLEGIEPILAKQGFKIKQVNFSKLIESDVALVDGAVDFNVDQHTAYLEAFNKNRKADLVPIVHIPTVPTAIFSNKFTSIEQVKDGAKIAIPQDPSNAARAYRILEKVGWIKLKDNIDPVLLTINDIQDNFKNINIIEMDSANIPRILDEVDFGVIPGSIVYSAKVDPNKALLAEDLILNLELVVAVKKGNETKEWAKAIVAAYKSKEFSEFLATENKNNFWFVPTYE